MNDTDTKSDLDAYSEELDELGSDLSILDGLDLDTEKDEIDDIDLEEDKEE